MAQEEFMKKIFEIKGANITRQLLHVVFNEESSSYIPPNTKLVLDEKMLKEADSEFCKFKNAGELYGKETTFGRFIVNLALYNVKDMQAVVTDREQKIRDLAKDVIGSQGSHQQFRYDVDIKGLITYKNFTLTAKDMDKIYSEMSQLFIDEKITYQAMNQFIDNLNWLGFTMVPYVNPSMDILSMSPTKEIKKIRADVFKEHKDIIDRNDVVAYNNVIEPKILSQASKILDEKGSSGKIIFDSGVNGSFSGNYKITAVARGVVAKSDDPTQYSIATSSLVEGVSKDEVGIAGDIAVQGSLGRAIDTRQGGYKVKQFYAGFQSVVADAPGTDCKTPYTIKVDLDDKNYGDYLFRYVAEGDKLVLLDRDNKSKYLGKTVKMRTPFFCQNPKICNKCAGEMLGKLGIKNIGLTSANIGSALLNASLKAFHSLSVKTEKFDLEDFMEAI
jgi:hypothetical protein